VNTRNLLLASLIGGAVSLILTNVPVINLVNCLLCAGFWAGPLFAVWIYKRQTGSVTLGQGVAIGALAGVWSGVIGLAQPGEPGRDPGGHGQSCRARAGRDGPR
jgi:hypothetical protein